MHGMLSHGSTRALLSAGILAVAAGCERPAPLADEGAVYTLIRSSVTDQDDPLSEKPKMRIHVATFDAEQGESSDRYNSENCDAARALFAGQPGVRVRYWCEKGRYRP